MKTTSVGAFALVAALQTALVSAQTSLYIPGFDPQAITADIEGVDAQGRTTWRFGPGVSSGTFEDPAGLIGSATLIADATEAHLIYANTLAGLSLSEDCVVGNGVAVCSGVASAAGTVESITVTENAALFTIQGNGAVPTAGADPATTQSGAADTASPTQGSGASAGPAPTAADTSAGAPNPTNTDTGAGNNNGVGKVEGSMVVSLGVVGLVSAFFL